jgi:hypothetical protein
VKGSGKENRKRDRKGRGKTSRKESGIVYW